MGYKQQPDELKKKQETSKKWKQKKFYQEQRDIQNGRRRLKVFKSRKTDHEKST